jgi:PKD repeat protein
MKKILIYFLLFIAGNNLKAQTNYIIGYEYWYDTVYSAHHYVPVILQQQLSLDTSLGFPGIEKGLHIFHIRFQQSNGFWSQTMSEYFYKTGESNNSPGKISSYRYWVEGKDTVITVHLSTPVHTYNLSATLDLSWVERGSNKLYMQFMDEQENWSVASVDSFYKIPLPVAAFYSEDTLTCTNDSVHFINTSVDADNFLWFFGDGDSSDLENPVHYYSQPGTYSVTLIVSDTVGGLDSTYTLTNYIQIHSGAQASFTFTRINLQVSFVNTSVNANNYVWDFGDGDISFLQDPVHTYQQDGNYTVILTAYDSCGSVTDTQYVSLILSENKLVSAIQADFIHRNDILTIHFNASIEKCRYSLQNVSGQVLLMNEISEVISGYEETISLANLSTGMYFLVLRDENSVETRRFFVN